MGADFTQALERAWIRPYGAPHMLQFDEVRPFNSEEQKWFFEQRGVQPIVAPGEAHFRLGVVEKGHQVFRAAVETYVEQEKLPLTWE